MVEAAGEFSGVEVEAGAGVVVSGVEWRLGRKAGRQQRWLLDLQHSSCLLCADFSIFSYLIEGLSYSLFRQHNDNGNLRFDSVYEIVVRLRWTLHQRSIKLQRPLSCNLIVALHNFGYNFVNFIVCEDISDLKGTMFRLKRIKFSGVAVSSAQGSVKFLG